MVVIAAARLFRSVGPFAVVLGVTVVAWYATEVRQRFTRRKEAVNADRGSLTVLAITYIAGLGLAEITAVALPAAAIRPHAPAAWLGLILMWCGIALRVWCFVTLGRYFTFTVQTSTDQPLVTGGPYRLIRHPSYAGLLLVFAGLGLLSGNWVSALVLPLVVMVGLGYRIRVEERALIEAMGDAYRTYAATHRRLIPFVW